MGQTRSMEEIERIIADYRASGLTRREYCEQRSMKMAALDYYQRRLARKARRKLVKVTVTGAGLQAASGGFTLVLTNGRRIESTWNFGEPELTRLIGIAERA